MLEYLEKLAEEEQWQKAIEYAEQLLLKPENKPWDLMVIYTRLLQARFETDEFYGAQVAGELALKMAMELEAWDYVGTASLWLGVTHERLRQPESALSAFHDYLTHVSLYSKAKKYHTQVLRNIGTLHMKAARYAEAINVLDKAAHLATACQDHRSAHAIRFTLINAHLRAGNFREVPSLLVKCSHYLRHNPSVRMHNRSLLTYYTFKIQHATATNRIRRAMLVAKRGLQLAELPEAVEPVYDIHCQLARLYERGGDLHSALGEGVRARTLAIEARRFDLEYQITDYIYGLLSTNPDLVEKVKNARNDKED